ncbi:DUF1816 domain-containing protein [Oculatella sp. LEGE 06141]|uniref:DUF1816 domain-containing protein n=1 Tax=Oculatella sp. LEGE 06141 TaxID=1828648 RepID=UPI0018828FCE|nr:DUF1816 domain-containing protein [Oculatella sp. LEGE 06141]MBE9179060.1 DUF1816 domain-containing protein [Oculatella sp. LEGE 06141]
MGLFQSIKGIFGSIFTLPSKEEGFAWWVEIITTNPSCTYFFGPFDSAEEAKTYQSGYVEDLTSEGANVFTPQVRWCKPEQLTIYTEKETAEV